MMNNILKVAILLSVIITSCKPVNEPYIESEAPVFQISAVSPQIGELSMVAGENNIYLFTDFSRDSGILKLSGAFSNANCRTSDCPGTLQFKIHLKETEDLGATSAFPFLSPNSNLNGVQTLSISPADTTGIEFNVEVAGISGQTVPTLVNIFNDSPVEIQISALEKKFQSKSLSKLRYLPNNPDSCKSVQLVAQVANEMVNIRAEIPVEYDNFTWSNGETVAKSISVNYADAQQYAITVSNIDSGCSASVALSHLPESTQGDSISTPGILVETSGISNEPFKTGIEVIWITNEGDKFSSSYNIQPSTSFFSIAEIQPYEVNENGQTTLKLAVNFRCTLSDNGTSGAEPIILTGNGVIGVAVPD